MQGDGRSPPQPSTEKPKLDAAHKLVRELDDELLFPVNHDRILRVVNGNVLFFNWR